MMFLSVCQLVLPAASPVGELDRDALARLVFEAPDRTALRRLNKATHLPVAWEVLRQLAWHWATGRLLVVRGPWGQGQGDGGRGFGVVEQPENVCGGTGVVLHLPLLLGAVWPSFCHAHQFQVLSFWRSC